MIFTSLPSEEWFIQAALGIAPAGAEAPLHLDAASLNFKNSEAENAWREGYARQKRTKDIIWCSYSCAITLATAAWLFYTRETQFNSALFIFAVIASLLATLCVLGAGQMGFNYDHCRSITLGACRLSQAAILSFALPILLQFPFLFMGSELVQAATAAGKIVPVLPRYPVGSRFDTRTASQPSQLLTPHSCCLQGFPTPCLP